MGTALCHVFILLLYYNLLSRIQTIDGEGERLVVAVAGIPFTLFDGFPQGSAERSAFQTPKRISYHVCNAQNNIQIKSYPYYV